MRDPRVALEATDPVEVVKEASKDRAENHGNHDGPAQDMPFAVNRERIGCRKEILGNVIFFICHGREYIGVWRRSTIGGGTENDVAVRPTTGGAWTVEPYGDGGCILCKYGVDTLFSE